MEVFSVAKVRCEVPGEGGQKPKFDSAVPACRCLLTVVCFKGKHLRRMDEGTAMTYLVMFRLDPGEYDAEFHELNDAIQAAAEDTEGYLGKRTWHALESEEVLVAYYWESLDAVETFGAYSEHKEAKQRWTEWYDAYEVTVTEVIESYGSGFGDDGDPPA